MSKSLNDELPILGSVLNIYYLTFCTVLKVLNKVSRIAQKRMGQYKKRCVVSKCARVFQMEIEDTVRIRTA